MNHKINETLKGREFKIKGKSIKNLKRKSFLIEPVQITLQSLRFSCVGSTKAIGHLKLILRIDRFLLCQDSQLGYQCLGQGVLRGSNVKM